jgi:hypothetical protein
MTISNEMVLNLSERTGITVRDAWLVFVMVPFKEIYRAMETSTVPELRDRALITLRDSINERLAEKETCSQEQTRI